MAGLLSFYSRHRGDEDEEDAVGVVMGRLHGRAERSKRLVFSSGVFIVQVNVQGLAFFSILSLDL